jgi:CBS domain containing-hemolysin-like protein
VNEGLPSEGEVFTVNGWRFEVVDMDRQRIDKILASPVKEPPVEAGRAGQPAGSSL